MTRRTRGISLTQTIKELKVYLVGWRGYFGFCQTPRVLTNLEAWILRRLRSSLWRQWQNGRNRFPKLRRRGVPRPGQRLQPVRRPALGGCRDTPPSNRPCETTTSKLSVFPASMWLPELDPVEPPCTDPYARWCGRGGVARCPPIPINHQDVQIGAESIQSVCQPLQSAIASRAPANHNRLSPKEDPGRHTRIETAGTILLI